MISLHCRWTRSDGHFILKSWGIFPTGGCSWRRGLSWGAGLSQCLCVPEVLAYRRLPLVFPLATRRSEIGLLIPTPPLVPRCSVNCESRITPLLRPIEREKEREMDKGVAERHHRQRSKGAQFGSVCPTGILNKRSPESERFRALCSFRNSWRHRINFT